MESQQDILKRKQPINSPPDNSLDGLMHSLPSSSKRSRRKTQFEFLQEDPFSEITDFENFVEIATPPQLDVPVINTTKKNEDLTLNMERKEMEELGRYKLFASFISFIFFKFSSSIEVSGSKAVFATPAPAWSNSSSTFNLGYTELSNEKGILCFYILFLFNKPKIKNKKRKRKTTKNYTTRANQL